MDDLSALVRLAASRHPVAMSDVLAVGELHDALAPHLRGLTQDERLDEVHRLLSAFLDECEAEEEVRGKVTTVSGGLDQRQMAIIVGRLILWPAVGVVPDGNGEDEPFPGVTARRAAAVELPGFGDGLPHNNTRRIFRNTSEFGRAFAREFIVWVERQDPPEAVVLTELVAPSRVRLDESPEMVDMLEEFVDGDETLTRLVAAGLQLPESPPLAVAHAELTALLAEWEAVPALSVDEQRTHATMVWLTRLLREDEWGMALTFAVLPEGLSLPLDMLENLDTDASALQAAVRLLTVHLLEEVDSQRYRMPVRLHRRLSSVFHESINAEMYQLLYEAFVDHYGPLLEATIATVELHRFADSKTYRLLAGYGAADRALVPLDNATRWWETESRTIAAFIRWKDPIGHDKLALRKSFERLAHGIATEDPAELIGWITRHATEERYHLEELKKTIDEFDRDRAENLAALAALEASDVPASTE